MIEKFKTYFYEPKSKIGWVHGSISCMAALLLAFLTMMLVSKFIIGDYAIKMVPSMIFTPILISFYGIWILFSKNLMQSLLKVFLSAFLLMFLLKVV